MKSFLKNQNGGICFVSLVALAQLSLSAAHLPNLGTIGTTVLFCLTFSVVILWQLMTPSASGFDAMSSAIVDSNKIAVINDVVRVLDMERLMIQEILFILAMVCVWGAIRGAGRKRIWCCCAIVLTSCAIGFPQHIDWMIAGTRPGGFS